MLEYSGCGFAYLQETASVGNQLNETELQLDKFPWTVIISNDSNYLGSGSLLSPNTVLTAASILIEFTTDALAVTAGEWNIENDNEKYPHQVNLVGTIIRHEAYAGGLINNVALLILQSDFIFQPNIRSICLPVSGAMFDYSKCKTTAWVPSKTSIPIMSQLEIQPRSKCEKRLPSEYLYLNSTLDESLMCAMVATDQNILYLNSGTPLFCPLANNPNRYTQAGIVIGSIDRSNAITGLFVNVTHLMPWIFSQLGSRQTDLKYYLPFNEYLCDC